MSRKSTLPPAASAGTPRALPDGVLFVLLVAFTLIAYLPLWRAGWVWDDDHMVFDNRFIKAANGLHDFWFTTHPQDYWPVTSTLLWFQWRWWGLHAIGYHAVNLTLHVAEVLLFWSILRRWRMPGAWVAALLFAVHPLNVESVTWIAEVKNVTAMLFFLLCIRAFQETGLAQGEPEKGGWYPAALGAFVLAMLSKGSVATLPLILLGIIAWRRVPRLRDCLRLAPFFAVAGVLTLVDIWFQHHGSAEVVRHATLLERALGAGAVLWFYLGKSLWPSNLMFVNPQWRIDAGNPLWWLPLLAAIALTVVLWRYRRRGTRSSLFAWGYFCVSLIPALGLTDVYFMRYSLVANHYVHLALLGVCAWAAAGWARVGEGSWRAWSLAALGLGVAALGALTWAQNLTFANNVALFSDTIAKNPNSAMARNVLGLERMAEGRNEAAMAEFEAAIALRPDWPEAQANLGVVDQAMGRDAEAMAHFQKAIALRPDLADARMNLGSIYLKLGRPTEAADEYERALQLRPGWVLGENNFAAVLTDLGRPEEAIRHCQAALRLLADEPAGRVAASAAIAHTTWAKALLGEHRDAEAADQCRQALGLVPGYAAAHRNLGLALVALGKATDAIPEFQAALAEGADDVDLRNDLGVALARAGRAQEAIPHLQAAVRLAPERVDLHHNLAIVLNRVGQTEAAQAQLELANRLKARNP